MRSGDLTLFFCNSMHRASRADEAGWLGKQAWPW